MKKLKIVLFLSAMMALSVGGFVNSQIENGIELQSIEQLMAFNKAFAGNESAECTVNCYGITISVSNCYACSADGLCVECYNTNWQLTEEKCCNAG
jgi:Tfp pilus assembly protein PilX